MALSKYYKTRFWSSFWVILFLVFAIFLVRNKRSIALVVEDFFDFEFKQRVEQKGLARKNALPLELLPKDQINGELIHKENYLVYYDETKLSAKYTFHILTDTSTKGSASRYGLRFDENEKVFSHTPQWADFSNSGYDRGHLVPAGDFQCCQSLLANTFAMTNVAAFDSVLNRYAWQELEIEVRKLARRFGAIYVFTGTVFQTKEVIGRYNSVKVPSHFYKIVIIPKKGTFEPRKVYSFVLPNEAVYHFDKSKFAVNVDYIEALTGLDFFTNLDSQKEIELEGEIDVLL